MYEPSVASSRQALPIPIIMVPVPSIPALPSSGYARYHPSYPEHDEWSVSSVSSDSTATTTDSTITSESPTAVKPDAPFHNPRYLGSLDYYFPRRLRPIVESVSPPSLPLHPLPTDDMAIDVIHDIHPIQEPAIVSERPRHPAAIDDVIRHHDAVQVPSLHPADALSNAPTSSSSPSAYRAPPPISLPESLSMSQLLRNLPATPSSQVTSRGSIDPTPLEPNMYNQQTLDQCWDNFQNSSTNVKSNEPWGDSIEVKCSNIVPIYFQNVNSFGLSQGTNKVNTIFQSMQHIECDIANFVQTSIN